jgi:hypothetical protein
MPKFCVKVVESLNFLTVKVGSISMLIPLNDSNFPILYFRAIPQQGNTAEVVLTALHRNFLGVDEFLGIVTLPLRDFDVYERPKTK